MGQVGADCLIQTLIQGSDPDPGGRLGADRGELDADRGELTADRRELRAGRLRFDLPG